MTRITFKCPHCGRELSVPAQKVGRKGKCAGCGELVVVPGAMSRPTDAEAPAAEGPEREAPDDEDPDEIPAAPRAMVFRRRNGPAEHGELPEISTVLPADIEPDESDDATAGRASGIAGVCSGLLGVATVWFWGIGALFGTAAIGLYIYRDEGRSRRTALVGALLGALALVLGVCYAGWRVLGAD